MKIDIYIPDAFIDHYNSMICIDGNSFEYARLGITHEGLSCKHSQKDEAKCEELKAYCNKIADLLVNMMQKDLI